MATYLGNGQFRIESGDTLWGLAQQTLGNGSRWQDIQGYSGDPRQLRVGAVVTVPGYRGPQESTSSNQAPAETSLTVDQLAQQKLDEANKRWEEATVEWKKNLPGVPEPFAFDEKLATEQVRSDSGIPEYYQEQRSNYLADVQTLRRQFTTGVSTTLDDLSSREEYQEKQAQRELQESLRKTDESYAANDLFFSGLRGQARERVEVPITEALQEFLRQSTSAQDEQRRRAVEQLGTQEALNQGLITQGDLSRLYGDQTIAGTLPTQQQRALLDLQRGEQTDITKEVERRKIEQENQYDYTVVNPWKEAYGEELQNKPQLTDYL
jgi:hypothetical protein